MSDLAPFVAAVIESRVVTELQEENQRLRAEIAQTRAAALQSARFGGCVQITGEGGSPVYAHGKVQDAEEELDDDDALVFALDLTNDLYPTCPISKAMAAEIRVNGVKVASIGEYDDDRCNSSYGDVYAEFRYHFLGVQRAPWGAFGVEMRFGPLAPLADEAPEPHQMKDEEVEDVAFTQILFTVSKTSVRSGDVLHDIITRD
ncbi:hypothetical protein ACHAXT_006848 [Thalassiosira profunda]